MIAAFDWWLLILGLVIGAGLTWLVVSESRRRDDDLDEAEQAAEAAWIAARLRRRRRSVDAALVEAVLAEHRTYLSSPPPDPDLEPATVPGSATGSGADAVATPRGRTTADVADEDPEPRPDEGGTVSAPAANEASPADEAPPAAAGEAAADEAPPARATPSRRRRSRRSEPAGEDGAVG